MFLTIRFIIGYLPDFLYLPTDIGTIGLFTAFAGGAPIQYFLCYFSVPIIPNNSIFIHRVLLFLKEVNKFMLDDPKRRSPDIFVHRRGYRADHPAIPIAAAYFSSDRFCSFTVPQFIPSLQVQVAHDLLRLCTITGHHISEWIDEEGIKAHIAGQQPFLTINVINQTMVKVSTHPLLGAVGFQQFVDQILEVRGYHRAVMDDIIGFHKVETIV